MYRFHPYTLNDAGTYSVPAADGDCGHSHATIEDALACSLYAYCNVGGRVLRVCADGINRPVNEDEYGDALMRFRQATPAAVDTLTICDGYCILDIGDGCHYGEDVRCQCWTQADGTHAEFILCADCAGVLSTSRTLCLKHN